MNRCFVGSEVGTLHRVLLHRPDLELRRLTPSNCQELLFDDNTLKQVVMLRRMLAAAGQTEDVLQAMLFRMGKTTSNAEFLATLNKDLV